MTTQSTPGYSECFPARVTNYQILPWTMALQTDALSLIPHAAR
jgi:hypothetical protein